MKFSIYFLILVAIMVMLILRLITSTISDRNKNNSNKKKQNDDDIVIRVLSECSARNPLYKIVMSKLAYSISKNEETGGLVGSYDFYKIHIASLLVDIIDELSTNKNGYKWLNQDIGDKITKDNLLMSIKAILDSPIADKTMAKQYSLGITRSIELAQFNEKKAIDDIKKYEEAPGDDEELHPRIPEPGENSDEEIRERSIEELSSMGTVESIDD